MAKIGVLLINLGTPDDCNPSAVNTYLKQFLNDPRVVDLPKIARHLLVNWFIIPFRVKRSARAYQKIWSEKGSPLLTNSLALASALADKLGDKYQIELGMRYGNPSIESALAKLKDCQKIIAIPLFPQYASAATGSAIEELLRVLASQWNIPELQIKRDFFNDPGFIQAYAALIKTHLTMKKIDKLIFSYHGLPERHIDKSECQVSCQRISACPTVDHLNAYCYRAQCYETSRLIANELKLDESQFQVTFQSRLGRTPWIKPYTDIVLPELIQQKIENIAIVCPSFVADCLETLEEIDIQARAQWQSVGGKEFTFIPCLNDNALWVNALAQMVNQNSMN